jgi:hypothetical protein
VLGSVLRTTRNGAHLQSTCIASMCSQT